MKRLLVVLFLGFSISSCVYDDIEEIENIEEVYYDKAPKYFYKFTFDGHDYIMFENGYDIRSGYVHDPECLKKDIREILTEQNNKK